MLVILVAGLGKWAPMSRAHFDEAADSDGAVFVGSPATVARKIAKVAWALGLSRFDLKYSIGTLPHESLMRSIERYGTKVAPLVLVQLSLKEGEPAPSPA